MKIFSTEDFTYDAKERTFWVEVCDSINRKYMDIPEINLTDEELEDMKNFGFRIKNPKTENEVFFWFFWVTDEVDDWDRIMTFSTNINGKEIRVKFYILYDRVGSS